MTILKKKQVEMFWCGFWQSDEHSKFYPFIKTAVKEPKACHIKSRWTLWVPFGDGVIQHRPKQQRGITHDEDSEVEIDTEHLQDSLLACLTKRHIYIPSVGNTSNSKILCWTWALDSFLPVF